MSSPVRWSGRDFCNNLELLNREVALANQCINQRQITDDDGTAKRILANRHEFDRAPRFADGLFFPAKPGINSRDFPEVELVLGLARPRGLYGLPRVRKRHLRFLLIALNARELLLAQ